MTTTTKTPVAGMTPLPATGTNRGHGSTAWALGKRCPCPKCRATKNAYQRRTYRLKAYGQWQPLIDATPSREHLANLHEEGISYYQVAEQTGMHFHTVRRIAHGITRSLKPETAATILALSADGVKRKVLPALGSARRLQALMAVGWPLKSLGPYIGVHPDGVLRLIHQPYIFRSTADAVAACYEQLKDQRPEDHGVSRIGAQKSRGLAVRRGWPDPLWWEDMGRIDDPDFDPATVEQELGRNEEAAVRRAEIKHLMSFGLDHETIAGRMDMHPTTVRNIMNELKAGKRRDRSRGVAA